jgi:glucokinase
MILAGDIGGTKCHLALFEEQGGRLRRVERKRFASRDYAHLDDVVREFLRSTGAQVTSAGFGVAGPVVEGRVEVTNLPWVLEASSLAPALGLERVVLLNDLEALGYGLEALEPSDVVVLNQGAPAPGANRALLAAGTGLGEAVLFWDGARYRVSATEGGHSDFAPRDDREIELLRFLRKKHAAVSWEHILSGSGFRRLHEFLDASVRHASFDDPDADPAPEITAAALAGGCPVCVETLDLWVSLYGAEAGNLALKTLARGGVYVGGGIAAKIIAKMKDGAFVESFCRKSKFRILLTGIPIYVVVDEDAPLLGAAVCARAGFAR